MAGFRLVTKVEIANPNVHDLYLDDSGQLEIIGADIIDIEDCALEIAQRVKSRILLVRGEWYIDQRVGTPWKERLLVKGATAGTIRRVLREVVLGTPGVRSIRGLSVSVDGESRTATVTDLEILTDTRAVVTIAALDAPMIIEVPHG